MLGHVWLSRFDESSAAAPLLRHHRGGMGRRPRPKTSTLAQVDPCRGPTAIEGPVARAAH
jgi:hypothetical protein